MLTATKDLMLPATVTGSLPRPPGQNYLPSIRRGTGKARITTASRSGERGPRVKWLSLVPPRGEEAP